MLDCDCFPCQQRQTRVHTYGASPCIYSGPYGLRRPTDPMSPAELAQMERAREGLGLIRR